MHGIPITPDFYVVNYNQTLDPDPNNFYHLTATSDTTVTHVRVAQFADQMFYQVIVIKDYTGQYQDIGEVNENKLTWGELKRRLFIK